MVIAKDKVSYWLWDIRFYFCFGIGGHKLMTVWQHNSSGGYLLDTDKSELKMLFGLKWFC